MTRTTLLATAGLCFIAVPAAFADGDPKRFTGLGDIGYDLVDIDAANGNLDQVHGTGSMLWTWPGKWNVQANFDFNSYEGGALTDSKVGVGLFWRDPGEYMLGGELSYIGIEGSDGIDLTGRGELYLSEFTIGALIGYGGTDNFDNWHLGAYGSYYLQSNLGLNLITRYVSNDIDAGPDIDDWSLNGEVEYLLPEYDTSVYGGLGVGNIDGGANDSSYWTIGAGLRFHLGNEGSLQQRNRAEPIRTVREHFIF